MIENDRWLRANIYHLPNRWLGGAIEGTASGRLRAVRAQLQAALEFVREGDVLVVTKLDRLVRSVAELMVIIQALDQK